MNNDMSTLRKMKANHGVNDTAERKEGLIESLKRQISDMSISHEKEVQALCNQIERLTGKVSQYDNLRNELQLSREIIDSHKEFRQEAERMEQENSLLRADLMSKDNHLEFLKQKMQKTNKIIIEL